MQSDNITVLTGIGWETYEHILRDHESRSAPRFTYDQGDLEIVTLLLPHEEIHTAVVLLVGIVLEEWEIEHDAYGSATFRRADMQRGVEPDSCFYIQNVGALQGKHSPNLTGGDLPPDLVIEVEITHTAEIKILIYAAFGLSEVWRVTEESVTILVLREGNYVEQGTSLALSALTRYTLEELLEKSQQMGRPAWRGVVRDWAIANRPQDSER